MAELKLGMKAEKSELVTENNTAATVGSGSLPVYATPAMIALIEQTAVKLLDGQLDEGLTTVGTKLDIAHTSATPIGLSATCVCELVEIDRKRLVFDVKVSDACGVIGKGTHERFIVKAEPFVEKANAKCTQA